MKDSDKASILNNSNSSMWEMADKIETEDIAVLYEGEEVEVQIFTDLSSEIEIEDDCCQADDKLYMVKSEIFEESDMKIGKTIEITELEMSSTKSTSEPKYIV